ncbi:DUF3857 domain-containing protein [Psychroserpens luteolus]|uniref:DUF3857 domain-containing protein n=1 Tax=Psychroserpens luteolus TaxID=2855840 RepID=UPI001E345FD8|nr:DUF3857 domain-containing protein [Psychroserpens luteolus]MCD2260711.1 DUF3857 domain-containing protein [Psychroserpens luteolus]
MPFKILVMLFLTSLSSMSFAQEADLYKSSTIPFELKIKSNAVIRYDKTDIEVKAYNKFIYKRKRIVTVFNEGGIRHQGTVESYDKRIKIKTLEARIYDKNGNEIKKFKEKDFEDVSAVSGGTLYSDSRVKYLEYTPISYPYTVSYEVEVEYTSTAFFPSWSPINGFYVSAQNSEYKITNNSGVELKTKAINLENYNIEKHSDHHYTAKNLTSLKPEAYSPSFRTFAPVLRVALTEFEMEGVRGINNNWQDFGKWMHDELLSGTEALPDAVKTEIKALTKNATSDIEKARIVYNYMQEKTRYISVQVGIGGWKPMLAEDVERLGYADCKGLSNYTKALLKEVGVEAHYAVIYGDEDLVSIDKEFSATEGNHVVLCVPNEEKDIWLECTSQTNPFGFIASFTDDRDALLITPEGGKIVHTTTYKTEDNLQLTNADVNLMINGEISGSVTIKTYGYQYAKHEGIQKRPLREQELYFKEYWDYINNLSVENIEFNNDKDHVEFTEKVNVSSSSFVTKTGKRLLFQPNAFNRIKSIPTRYENRTLDFEIERGYKDVDEFVIKIAPDLKVEAMPNPIEIVNKFGTYKFSIEKRSEHELVYKRTHILNKGYYPKEEYDDFRSFMSTIVKYDKTKVVLTTN